jgi:hypothetical protein
MSIESISFHNNRQELKKALRELVLSTEPRVFATAVFNDYASTDRARSALRRLHANLDRKIFGRYFYKTAPQKRTFFFAFPEHVRSNLHFHLMIRPPANSTDRLLTVAPAIWKKICPQGNLKLCPLDREDDLRMTSYYSVKDSFIEENFERFIISSEFCS